MSNNCETCYEDFIVKCNTTINVFAKLAATTAYTWVITDKFDRQYQGTFITDAFGFWEILVADLPEGLLTEFSGSFKLEVFAYEAYPAIECKPIKFTIANEYDCIIFNVRAGTRIKDNLGCDF